MSKIDILAWLAVGFAVGVLLMTFYRMNKGATEVKSCEELGYLPLKDLPVRCLDSWESK